MGLEETNIRGLGQKLSKIPVRFYKDREEVPVKETRKVIMRDLSFPSHTIMPIGHSMGHASTTVGHYGGSTGPWYQNPVRFEHSRWEVPAQRPRMGQHSTCWDPRRSRDLLGEGEWRGAVRLSALEQKGACFHTDLRLALLVLVHTHSLLF